MQSIDLKEYSGPLVYLFMGTDGPLYVGVGSNLTRPFSLVHHRLKIRKHCLRIDLIFCKSSSEAKELERKLIRAHRPFYNRIMYERQPRPKVSISKRDPAEVLGDFTDPATGEWVRYSRSKA